MPLLNLAPPRSSPLHLPAYLVALFGKYLCYALLAVALDLVWGYCGILSLGHGAFFALGGYAMGMYLMRQIGTRGVYGNPILPDFMVFLNWKELPWYLVGLSPFPFALLMVLLVPGLLALGVRLVRLPLARHRRLSLDHHPGDDLRPDAGLFPQRHGVRRQQRPDRFQGHPGLQCRSPTRTRAPCSRCRRSCWRSAIACARAIVSSKFGKVLIAIRDAEIAGALHRLPGGVIQDCSSSPFSAMMAGVAGALYVPQVGIINPSEFAPANSIEAVIWVAIGGRGTLVGAALGAILVNFGKSWFTDAFPEFWLFALGALFIAVTLFLPQGHRRRGRPWRARRLIRKGDGGARQTGGGVRPWTIRSSPAPCSISTISASPSTATRPCAASPSCWRRARCAPSSARTAPARRR